METDSKPELQPGQRPRSAAMWKVLIVAVLVVLFYLLAQSMVDHRFFEGQRVHNNGSVGQ
jgi:hypothetical protein